MAIKKNILRQLSKAKEYINLAKKNNTKDWHPLIVQNITKAEEYCKQGLSTNIYPEYGELYDLVLSAMNEISLTGYSAKNLSLCEEMIHCIEMQTSQEMRFKKEAVFLPYQVSMWDSLESVWKAGQADEAWNTYVIPIPYCERDVNRDAVRWYCDRDKFPPSVPILSWEAVDLYTWHPEVIYIHNPYDEYNYVTSVDSQFYSSRLKLCTDKLVYIPYFILGEPDFTASENPLENQKELIVTSAVENADVVVAQSENMREAMIRLLIQEKGGSRKYWEDKILGIGSPKLDRVSTTDKESYVIPKAWQLLIGNHKVVLYNTSVSAAIKHKRSYLQKIRSVLESFRKNKDATLWWRPHPLLESALGAISPALRKEFEDIVQIYKEEGWGIFDDTPELNRAIVCTDGYYGDMSSLVQLYEQTGKPIMIQVIT